MYLTTNMKVTRGIVLVVSIFVLLSGSVEAAPQRLQTQGQVVAVRSVIVNDNNQIQTIYSNSVGPAELRFYRLTLSRSNEILPTNDLLQQYLQCISDQTLRVGIIYQRGSISDLLQIRSTPIEHRLQIKLMGQK